MKNLTLTTAIKLGFDFENSSFESKEELEQLVIDFLFLNTSKLPKLKYYCEVTGIEKNVKSIDYTWYGQIMTSNYLVIDKNGKCFQRTIWNFIPSKSSVVS